MAIFGRKKEEDVSKSPNFVKVAYDAQHRPIGVRSAEGMDITLSNISSAEKEWFKKWFESLNQNIESLRSEIGKTPAKESPRDLVQFLSKWKQDFNNNLDEVMFRIQTISKDSEIVKELRHVDEGLTSLKKEIHSDTVPKEDIIGRLIDIQSKMNNMNQQIYQKLVGKYELADEIAKNLKDVLQVQRPEQKVPKIKINRTVFDRIVMEYLEIRNSEKVVVLTDKKMMKFGRILYEHARNINNNTLLVVMEKKSRDGEEPDESVSRLIKESDAVIIVTFYSLTQTSAVREALKTGTRIISLARVPIVSFVEGGMTADPKQVKTITEKMFDHLKNSNEIHVVSNNGTDVKFYVKDRKWFKNNGFVRNMGDFATLPAGSVMVAPVESSINGKIVFDQMKPKTNIELTVEDGVIKKFKGNIGKTKEIFDKLGTKALTVSEFSVGCNPRAKVIGNVSEDKKVFGAVNFGIGNNTLLEGEIDIPFHKDGIIERATVFVDDMCIIKEGKFLE